MARQDAGLALLFWVLFPRLGGAWSLKTTCKLESGKADCSRMNLNAVPPDLPADITALDVSHNRLKALQTAALAHYPGLKELDASFNSITTIEPGLCESLPRLERVSLQRNQVHLLTANDLRSCSRMTHLDLSDNRLKLRGEPFSVLNSLVWLDVSRNKLGSAHLGSRPQLPQLATLILGGNNITELRTEDFLFLNESSVRVLGLGLLPLKQVAKDCFKPIAGLQDLVLDGSKLKPPVLSDLCMELSETAVRNLSLQNTQQLGLFNNTFQGLVKVNLTILDLSNNQISDISEGTFKWLPLLEILSLQHNNIKHLTNGTFLGLKNLRQLNLRNALTKSHTSPFPVIDDFSFQPLVKLEYLCMEHTVFSDLTENIFAGLPNLRKLDLGWSTTGLKVVSNTTFAALGGSPLLRTLNLTGMAIKKLGPGAFSSLGNLTTLVLNYNFISQRLTGEELRGLNSVENISLSFNQQNISLTPTSFIHVPTLKALLLARALTGTLDIDPSPFRPLANLTVLDLNNNNIANINAGLLDGLHHLSVLKMQHNNLARVWKNANPGGPVLFLRGARNLSVLELDYNGLDEVPLMAFRGLWKLKVLSISGNLLNFLRDTIFDDLGSLRYLYLQKNLLTSVRRETFSVPLAGLIQLYMGHNPFDCTCDSILWFAEWLNTTSTIVPGRTKDYICNTPPTYFNHTMLDFQPDSCKDLKSFYALFILSQSLVLGLMFLAFLVHFQGWRIRFYWNIMTNRIIGMRDGGYDSLAEDRYEYDAYIVHAMEDKRWVERSLLPLEDEGLNFFTEDRNAVPGCSTLESIVDNMRRSRKILFVVTEALLQDPWCRRFKAQHALHQLMEESRDSLVLVFLQDLADHQLSQALLLRRGMLKRRCLVCWPLHSERISAFRQELRLALASSNRVS
ncbi:toll-like receptor 3 [Brachyhypopomus gauderio]|uniref:toll-like receptor 3 n=1 Tax=Brachyhypopomus gauderio TaxID=698409 RepID=UPI004042F88E